MRVLVDLRGLALALCPNCDAVGLAVPDGFCVECHAPAATLIFDPEPLRRERSDPLRPHHDGVVTGDHGVQLDHDLPAGHVDPDDDAGNFGPTPETDAGPSVGGL